MAGSYVTRAAIPTGDIYYNPSSDDDSDDDEFPPFKAFRTIFDEMKKDESLSFIEAWTQIRKRKRAGSWQLACL